MARSRARVLWSNPGNPPASVARALGMEPRHFSRALHKIKAASDLSGADRVIIYAGGLVTGEQGELVIFATRHRPLQGARGWYRAALRHGVSTIHRGTRYTLGIIFHDAK